MPANMHKVVQETKGDVAAMIQALEDGANCQ